MDDTGKPPREQKRREHVQRLSRKELGGASTGFKIVLQFFFFLGWVGLVLTDSVERRMWGKDNHGTYSIIVLG